jgi:ubiquinone/menaquinone biosynthesis C-methylase UbiE
MPDFPEPFADITYASFGIDPVEFYKGRFAGGPGIVDYLADAANLFDIEFSRLRFLTQQLRGGRVLDLGCGSGPYGTTLKRHCAIERLVGVDLDRECARIAAASYDEARVFDLDSPLPFEDGHFDAVFSADVFGHIEFRKKNQLLQEVHRVTKAGGVSAHIIESGDLDYRKIDFSNPDDPLRCYILMEGHVGIESPERVKARWEQYFSAVVVENAFVFPFAPLASYLSPSSFLHPKLRPVVASFTESERRAAQILLGFIGDHLKAEVRKIDPGFIMPSSSRAGSETRSSAERLIDAIFRKPCGLVFLSCTKT